MQVRRLSEARGGMDLLRALRGGVVGGAPVDAELAALLAETRLRVGYGQTEAAPGVCLGAPGDWRAGAIGQPVGVRDAHQRSRAPARPRGERLCWSLRGWRAGAKATRRLAGYA
jgi:acyl-CoA synthetase (AMP-forming)/AMP-acid ligase II